MPIREVQCLVCELVLVWDGWIIVAKNVDHGKDFCDLAKKLRHRKGEGKNASICRQYYYYYYGSFTHAA